MSPTDLTPITLFEQLGYKLADQITALGWVILLFVVLWVVNRFILRNWDIKKQLREKNIAVAIVVAAFILGWLAFAGSVSAANVTDKYDKYYERSAQRYWGAMMDWRLLKSQGLTESMLRTDVCSHAGACGIAQFMPATARQFRIDPFNARQSIDAQSRYMRQLYNQFSKRPRPHMDKMALAAASYNWGLGNVVRKAQPCAAARIGRDLLWADVRGCLPEETRLYWPRIIRWFSRLLVGSG